jgi:hypothetical protein
MAATPFALLGGELTAGGRAWQNAYLKTYGARQLFLQLLQARSTAGSDTKPAVTRTSPTRRHRSEMRYGLTNNAGKKK